ncbi:MAG: GTP 3',8-cyclase MoaA [Chloroflexi bacterium]|nr:GTP 3',8-cyclase MoaA [Chloroflexota bacterium]NOG63890.1 GTP 3',8-cyclase MoaA [Chloroflexota bacterium]
MPLDRFGRNIQYLRVSLTDKCNLRCVYCMPEDIVFRPSAELMQDDEVILLLRLFADLGFSKYRLTGGEPTIRANIVDIVRELRQMEGVRQIGMTTNGVLLSRLAQPLKEAGLDRVNISVDTLDPDKFQRITRWGKLEDVWNGILASEEAGLTPLKLNAVVVRGFNDDDIPSLAELTIDHDWQFRFIEMMPFADVAEFAQRQIVTDVEIRQRIEDALGPLEVVDNGKLDGEARLYRLPGARGTIGLISSVTEPFCASCNRARLTADGVLRLCLLRDKEVDLLTPLRQGATLEDLKQLILDGIWHKPWGHDLDNNVIPLTRVMSQIGG